jgi:hypothetical protein
MSSAKSVLRCQHIKVDGVQCGSPALRGEVRCHFHDRWERVDRGATGPCALGSNVLPALEDANSIQLALAEVMRLAIMGHIEYRVFSLLLSALRIAAANVKHLSPTPPPPHMVIDPESVENRPLGATAWSETEGKDYDMIDTTEVPQKPAGNRAPKPEKAASEMSAEENDAGLDSYERLVAGVARDPDFLNKPAEHWRGDKPGSARPEVVLNPWNQAFQRQREANLTP